MNARRHCPCPTGEMKPQALGKIALRLGLKHHDKLIFGTLNGATLRGFVESLGIFDDLPRLVVLVGTSGARAFLRLEARGVR